MLLCSAAKEPSVGLTIIKCLGSEDGYQREIGLRGVSHANGNCSTIYSLYLLFSEYYFSLKS